MASTNKPALSAAARRKSTKQSLIVKLKLSSSNLEKFPFEPPAVKTEVKQEASPPKDFVSPPPTLLSVANALNPASSTPIPNGNSASSLMPPPSEPPKKKGIKRTAAAALGADGMPKPRGKPGPKKKARLEDGSIDHSNTTPRAANGTGARLGPKANQGAINAGLRALDRTGKPCRKWQKGGFNIKSFTGVIWELPRWTAPPRLKISADSTTPTSSSSSKENENEHKDSSLVQSDKSNSVKIEASEGVKVESNIPTPALTAVPSVDSPAPAPPPVEASNPTSTSAAPIAIATA